MEWFTANDRRPDPYQQVIVALSVDGSLPIVIGLAYLTAEADGGDWKWIPEAIDFPAGYLVTHWMPTPPLPRPDGGVHADSQR